VALSRTRVHEKLTVTTIHLGNPQLVPASDSPHMSHITVQFLAIPPTRLPSPKSKRDPFLSSGRGGSGNIRRSYVSATGEPSPDVPSPCEYVSGSTTDDKASSFFRIENGKQLMSSGRGGSGNIQPSTAVSPDLLEAHPQTAAILSSHSAKLTQYEHHIRQVHAESKVIRSSGRGGSGNISHTRQRSRSQGSSAAPKMRLFTTKGLEKGSTRNCESVSQARDKEGMTKTDKRASRATCSSSGGSSALDAGSGYSEGKRGSLDSRTVAKSRGSVQSDPLAAGTNSEDAGITGFTRKRNSFLFRYSSGSSKYLRESAESPTMTTPPTSPINPTSPSKTTGSPLSWSGGPSLVSRPKASSAASVVLQDQEYVSFLDL